VNGYVGEPAIFEQDPEKSEIKLKHIRDNKEIIMKSRNLLFTFIICVIPFVSNAGSMRCGNKIIVTGDDSAEVLVKCGKPLVIENVAIEEKKDTKITEENSEKKIETKVEKWTYNLGKGTLLKILTFRNGILDSIESGDRI